MTPRKAPPVLSTSQRLASILKSARDIMRKDKGLNGDLDRLPMLTWLMFLKFIDDSERIAEEEANLAGDPLTPEDVRGPGNYLNPATVLIPTDPSQPFGNAGRNIVRAPAFFQFDLGLHKDFRPTEATRLEFRTEAFNALNRTNFSAPNSNRSNNAFGTITSTMPAREIQMALRLVF